MITKGDRDTRAAVLPLSQVSQGMSGTIVELDVPTRHSGKLLAMGVLPGVKVRLLQRFPSYVFQIGRSQFTVDRQLAEQMHLRMDACPADA